MGKVRVLEVAVVLAALASLPLLAQQGNASAQQSASSPAAAVHVNQSAASTAGVALDEGDYAIGAAGSFAGNASGNLARGLNGSAGAAGSISTPAIAISGAMLPSRAAGGVSGMLTAARQNVDLESGTRMMRGVAPEK
jgi:hypothetical protein